MPDSAWLPWERLDDRSPLALRVAAQTAREIVERRHDAGAFLTEADLADAAGVSRTPAREAMLQLEAWSLVRLLPKKGAVVTSSSAREHQDMLEFRAMVEVDAVRRIGAGSSAPDLRAALDEVLARQRAAVEATDALGFASADHAFHAEIVRGGGNAVVTGLLDTLGPRIARFTYLAITEAPARIPVLLAEHEDLARLAVSGDDVTFGSRVRQHLALGHSAALAAG